MDPIIDSDWLGCKNEPMDESQHVGNIARSWQWREMGINPPNSPPNKSVLENIAEDILVQKPLKIRCCDLPGYPRSTFLMVFSPDGTKVASTHGNHNIYLSELASGKHVRILKGHPRTPWCVAFHPSHPQLIGSGCLGGQVRVWDLSGGSEVWTVGNETVIASIAFHPREQLLVIATFNELYFWDWSQPAPFTKVSTNNINEKVRYVAFDSLGYKLITGISVWYTQGNNNSIVNNTSSNNTPANQTSMSRQESPAESPPNRQENPGSAQEMIVNSYQNLVQRYDSLVRNYQRLFMARHQLTNTNTTDRGTDPMETDSSMGAGSSSWSRAPRPSTSRDCNNDNDSPRRADDDTSGDGEGSGSRLLNFDVLSINSNPSRPTNSAQNQNGTSNLERSVFGSTSSAFQRLSDNTERARSADPNERGTRLLPNPFSSHTSRNNSGFSSNQPLEENAGSSRTSVFTSHRLDSPSARFFLQRRRNASLSHNNSVQTSTSTNTSPPNSARHSPSLEPSTSERRTNTPSSSSQRPSMTHSSTQISPVAAQTINESLDLIRDILRDSGTRLLNLITNMSLSTLASVERSIPRRRTSHSDDGEGPRAHRSHRSSRVRLITSALRRDFLSSESDSDSDNGLQVNLQRISAHRQNSSTSTESRRTNRLFVELNGDLENAARENESDRSFNISVTNNRFRVRSHSSNDVTDRTNNDENERNSRSNDRRSNTENMDNSRPSTSRDTSWMHDPFFLSSDRNGTPYPITSDLAYMKVKYGVRALHRHTVLLTGMWLRGTQTSMRHLRNMWENLRRRVLALHRQTGRHEEPNYYSRGLLERCRFLTEMRNSRNRNPRNNEERPAEDRLNEDSQQTQMSTDSTSSSIPTETEQNTAAGPSNATRTRLSLRLTAQSASLHRLRRLRNALSARRRLQTSSRWRAEDELRRRTRAQTSAQWSTRFPNRSGRRDNVRSYELHCTRNEIRMRAMQVLSIMFNTMMSCLEERGLSQLIIDMLRTLKKALALTCLMLMTNRLNRRENESPRNGQPESSQNENRQESNSRDQENANSNAESTEENVQSSVNTETQNNTNNDRDNDSNSTSSWPTSESDGENKAKKDKNKKDKSSKRPKSEKKTKSNEIPPQQNAVADRAEQVLQRWSNRLAVQIAAANRNTSTTARNRRESYNENRRQKALHRTNPGAHPICKRKVLPPSSTYRIPAMRCMPSKRKSTKPITATVTSNNETNEEPVAGPSNAQPGPSNEEPQREPGTSRNENMNEFEQRVNLFRIAHMHAVRLRTAARTRLRRLQTIRLYTPSSVREMFAIQSNNNENSSSGNQSLNNSLDVNRRPFTTYRPHILTRNDLSSRERPFDSILNNVAVPLVTFNDLPVNEGQSAQPQRMPRVHEYLQPIILAQNALVVEEGGGGGGGGGALGGLLDAGLMSGALPSPSHRVQAWDFTTGDTPDIADSTKNVVVQKCRIHNDASIDISKDGRILVALLPVPRLRNTNHWLGVYSLEWGRLGQCLHQAVLEQSAVSVALSPTARHLAVGLGSRRFTTLPHARNNVFALLYKLAPLESTSRTGLSPIRELEQNWEQGFTSLNCLRWAPQPGQGLVYANNTGQLIIMS